MTDRAAIARAILALALPLSSLWAVVVPLAPEEGSVFETLTDEQIAVFGGETRTNRLKIATKLKDAPKEAWQRQRPLVLKWKTTDGESEPWRVRLSTRPDFSNGRDLWFDRRGIAHEAIEDGKATLWTCPVPLANLELGKTYYWQVWSDVKCKEFRCGFTYPNGCKCGKSKPGRISSVASFRTAERPPRWIELEGRTDNVRDIGGWRTVDGGRVRMGLVYRGTAFNDNSVAGLNRGRNRLTVEDVRYLTEELGIKTDLDLRSPREVAGMTESPLGPKVRFVNVSSETYQGIFTDVGKVAMAKNFRLFCDRASYPIYFHCIHGADRTGSLAYVLNGILGVAKEDLEREWEARTYPKLSGVRNPWGERACAHYDRGFAQYGSPNDPLSERIRLYLLDCGVTQAEIDTFKSIMLDRRTGLAPSDTIW